MKGYYTIKAVSSGNSAGISIYEEIGGWGGLPSNSQRI